MASGEVEASAPGYRHRGLEELFRLARQTPLSLARDSFIFCRHGETDGNFTKIFQRADQPLNARGLDQAETAAQALRPHQLERIVSSTMKRAWTTAEIVGRPHKLAPEPADALRERWFGDLVGTPSGGYDWRDHPPNGETLETFVARAQAGLAAALATAPAATALVAHGGTLYVLAASLDLELTSPDYANATPLLIARTGGRWQATRLAPSTGSHDNIA